MLIAYQSTARVRAAQITKIWRGDKAQIVCGELEFDVDQSWIDRYNPQVGGFFVIDEGDYADGDTEGYAHYSPAVVFLQKYKLATYHPKVFS